MDPVDYKIKEECMELKEEFKRGCGRSRGLKAEDRHNLNTLNEITKEIKKNLRHLLYDD